MIKDCICKSCGKTFKGGPRAWYCPECRAERKKQTKKEYMQRKKTGEIRPIGSIDIYEKCGKKYVVEGSLQRYCPECAKFAIMEKDRQQGLKYYHENKEKINPIRNQKRRICQIKNCLQCGKPFDINHSRCLFCCDECRRRYINNMYNNVYGKRYRLKKKKAILSK